MVLNKSGVKMEVFIYGEYTDWQKKFLYENLNGYINI